MHSDVLGAVIGIGWWVSVFIAMAVLRRRMMHAIAVRVEGRRGRPISDPELWARIAWAVLKSMFWPIVLVAWLALGRPEPGSFAPVRRDQPATPELRHGDPVTDQQAARPTTPAGDRPPHFPTGPAQVTGAPAPKAPWDSSGPKTGTTTPAYVPSAAAARPAAPPSLPSPVLAVPRAECGAPQLAPDYAIRLLGRAGFPATPHNVFAVQERLGIMFSLKARQFIEGMGTPQQWQTFVRRAGYPSDDMHAWPQRVLNALARWDSGVVPHIQDFEAKYGAMLREGQGSGNGSFFGGRPDEPLPLANDWNLKGIARSSGRPMSAPR